MKAFYSSVSLSCLLLASSLSHGATLLDIYQQALENDPQLSADRAALEAGLESKTIGLSNLLPQIFGSASYGEEDAESESESVLVLPPPLGVQESISDQESDGDSTLYSITLRQPLFDMAAWYSYKQGGVDSEAAVVQFKADQQAFIIRVATAYFDVLRAIDTLETALAEQEALESQLEQTRQRYEVGLTAITEVHEVQAQYDSAAANAITARGNLAIFYEALEVLTGQQHDSVAPIEEDFPVSDPVPADRSAWVDFALENNYSLQTARLDAEFFALTAKARRSAHLPTLSASLSHQQSESSSDGTEFSVIPNEDFTSERENEGTSISLDLSIPVYTGGRTSAQRRQAYHQAMRAEDLANLAQRQTIQLARSSHLAVETGVIRVSALQQAVVSNQSALAATQAGYEVGTRTLVDVLLAQRNLFEAQRNYYDALYSYILDTLSLKQAAGILSPEDIVELNQWLNEAAEISPSEVGQ